MLLTTSDETEISGVPEDGKCGLWEYGPAVLMDWKGGSRKTNEQVVSSCAQADGWQCDDDHSPAWDVDG